jgi:hypothetical protein
MILLPIVVCNRIVRSIAELREFCDAAEARAGTTTLPLQKPLDIWMHERQLPDGSYHYEVTWAVVADNELAEMAEAEAEAGNVVR